MAGWPYASVAVFTFDSGIVTVPTSFTAVPNSPTGACWLNAIRITSDVDETVLVSLKDGNSKLLLDQFPVPAREVRTVPFESEPGEGNYQWLSSLSSGVTARMTGWS